MYDAAIIGGGISGLTAAYDLHRRGRRIVVLERRQQIGGNAISERISGFLMEHGPTTLNATVPQAVELSRELGLSAESLDLGPAVRKRYLRDRDDLLHGISVHPAGFFLSPYLSISARLSLVGEMFRPRMSAAEDESVHDFATRRFGREFADKVMAPLASGMFGGDSHRLSLHATFPKLKKMEQKHGSLIRGVMRARVGSEPGKRLFSFRDGIAMLPQRLARAIAGSVQTGAAVTSISKRADGYQVNTHKHGVLRAKAIILAVQPHVAAQLLGPLDIDAASAASRIDAPPMSVVFLGYRQDQVGHPLDSLGFLSVRDAGGIIAGAQFCSTMFSGRAPDGFISVSAYVGGCGNRDGARMPRDELMREVHGELAGLLQIRGEPVLSRCRQWDRSLPQYELGHGDRMDALETLCQRHEGLHVTGNYLKGVSVANCIGQARRVASDVDCYLGAAKVSTDEARCCGSGVRTPDRRYDQTGRAP